MNDQVLNPALTPVGSSRDGSGGWRRTAGAGGSGGGREAGGGGGGGRRRRAIARYSHAGAGERGDAPRTQDWWKIVDVATQRTTATAAALEGSGDCGRGTARVNITGRMHGCGPGGHQRLRADGLRPEHHSARTTSAQNAPRADRQRVVNTANFTARSGARRPDLDFRQNWHRARRRRRSPLPTVLGGACVTLNNTPLPLLATAPADQCAGPSDAGRRPVPLVVRSLTGAGGIGHRQCDGREVRAGGFHGRAGPGALPHGRHARRQGPSGATGRAADDIRDGSGTYHRRDG